MKKKPTRTQRVKTIANKALNKALFGLGIVGALTTACKKEDPEPIKDTTAPVITGVQKIIHHVGDIPAGTVVDTVEVTDNVDPNPEMNVIEGGDVVELVQDETKKNTHYVKTKTVITEDKEYKLQAEDCNGNKSEQTNTTINREEAVIVPDAQKKNFVIAENSAAGTALGNIEITDDGNVPGVEIVGGTGAGLFDIDNNGTITVAAGADLDYETESSYTLKIQLTDDDGNMNTVTVAISLGNIGPDGVRSGNAVVDMFPTIEEDGINPTGNLLAENGLPFGRIATDTTFDDGEVVSVEEKGDSLYFTSKNTTQTKSWKTEAEVASFYKERGEDAITDDVFDQMINDAGLPEGWEYNGQFDPENFLVHSETGFKITFKRMGQIISRYSVEIIRNGGDPSNFQMWRKTPNTSVYNIGYKKVHNALRVLGEKLLLFSQRGENFPEDKMYLSFEKKLNDELFYGEGKVW